MFLAALFALGLCGAAQATGSVTCISHDGEADVRFGLGSVPVMAVISAQITAPDVSLSTEDGTIGVANGFADAESMRIDFTDDIVNEIVARLRLFRADEQGDYAMAGTLQIAGHGAYAMICEGP